MRRRADTSSCTVKRRRIRRTRRRVATWTPSVTRRKRRKTRRRVSNPFLARLAGLGGLPPKRRAPSALKLSILSPDKYRLQSNHRFGIPNRTDTNHFNRLLQRHLDNLKHLISVQLLSAFG